MPDLKSYAEFVLGLYRSQLVDCGRKYPELAKEFDRDLSRLNSAIEQHGVRFTLETMPAFRKHFDKCLAEARLTPSGLLHFGVDKKGGTIPRLFRGLVLRVFDRSGSLKLNPDVAAISWIRQLLGVVRKLELDCGLKATRESVREFFRVDMEVRHGDLDWSDHVAFASENHMGSHFSDGYHTDVLSEKEPGLPGILPCTPILPSEVYVNLQRVADMMTAYLGVFTPEEWRFKHGPGAVADRRFGSYKYDFDHWPDRLEEVFPYADFAHANYAQVDATPQDRKARLAFSREAPAKLSAVPKTVKGPRLIASEPIALQWCQQSLKDYFYSRTNDCFIGRFIDYSMQSKNGAAALAASRHGKCVTIDLSSASDRVSCWHVERLFRRSPSLLRALQSCRSMYVRQDICRLSPKLYKLRKYSTMGNATTFPVQSLFFLSLTLACVLTVRKLPVTPKSIKTIGASEVRVFGDDIVAPKDCSGLLVELLHALGLRVNRDKTFLEGNFRESCGVDAFAGQDVTTVNVMRVPSRSSPGSIVSSVDVHHNLCEKGMLDTADFLRKTASRLGYGKIRVVSHGSGLFGWSSWAGDDFSCVPTRWNRQLHRLEVKCLVPSVKETRQPAKESAGLLQFFTEAPRVVTSAVSTLGYLAQRPSTRLSTRWVPA